MFYNTNVLLHRSTNASWLETYFRDWQVHHEHNQSTPVTDWKDYVPTEYCGKCAIYTQDEVVKTPVPYLLHYRLRGKSLKNINRYEYSALVGIVKKQDSNDSGRGRKRRSTFEFDEGHPLHATHCQVIRLKFKTPILIGKKVSVRNQQ